MIFFYALIAITGFALSGWLLSFVTRHYSHVDSMWSLFFAITCYVTLLFTDTFATRSLVITVAVTLWALRLSLFLTWRNWGKEDYRYETIKQNNAPHFWFKSLYIVFGFQALLAWIISYPLYIAIHSVAALNWMDLVGLVLFIVGFYWEVLADVQLMRFKQQPDHQGKVLKTGLWRYSRHPNYFGECLIWWGFAFIAAATGHEWGWFSPVLMTFLLLKVSGVKLMESTIHERRPEYAEYVRTTNAFIPGLPKQ